MMLFTVLCGEGIDPQFVLAVPWLLLRCYYFYLIFLPTAKWSSPKCLSAKEGIPLSLSSLASIVVRRASWFSLEYSLLDTLFMSFYSYSNMFLGCLVSLLNLCKLRYCDMELCLFPPSYIPRPLMYSPMYADCVSWVSLGVRQIVISGQGISTISTQYSSTGLPSATNIIFSCQQVTPEISYLQSLALFHITSF